MFYVFSTNFRTTNVVDVSWTVTVIITLLRLQSKLLITPRDPPPSDRCERWLPRRINTILLLSWRLFDRSKNDIITNSTCIWQCRCIINYSSWTNMWRCLRDTLFSCFVQLRLMADGQTDGRPTVALRLHSNTKYSDGNVHWSRHVLSFGQSCWVCTEHPIKIRKRRDRRTDRRIADTRQTRRHLLNSTRAKYFQFYPVTYFSVCA